jgi:hypothetical protein
LLFGNLSVGVFKLTRRHIERPARGCEAHFVAARSGALAPLAKST